MTYDEVVCLFSDTGAATRVKLCGLSRPQDVAAANLARPDLVGFVVDFPYSRRNVPSPTLGDLAEGVWPGIVRVGVFVDEPVEVIALLYRQGAVDAVQLHGNEDEGYLAALRGRAKVPIIQAFRMRSAADAARANRSSAELVLLDNGQGTGEAFDWSLVEQVKRPFLLAGGLDASNVRDAIAATHPWGVDMSSGVETDRAKDPHKMLAAVRAVRATARGAAEGER